MPPLYIPGLHEGLHDYKKPEPEQVETHAEQMSRITAEAEEAARKASTKPPKDQDRGIHRTREDIWEEELKAAGWEPTAVHPRSPVWIDPNPPDPHHRLLPGPGYAWLVMTERKQAAPKVT